MERGFALSVSRYSSRLIHSQVYEECNSRYEILKAKLNCIIDETVSYLKNDENSYFAVNPIDFERSGYAKHNGEWYRYSLSPYSSGKLEKSDSPVSLHFSKNVIENEHLKVVFNNKGQIEKYLISTMITTVFRQALMLLEFIRTDLFIRTMHGI